MSADLIFESETGRSGLAEPGRDHHRGLHPGIGALAAAFCGAAIYSHFRGAETGYLEFLRIWWFGDALGLMIFTPLLLSLRPYRAEEPTPSIALRPSDWLIGLAALAIVGVLVASRDGSFHGMHIGPASLLPFVIFVAARFGTRWRPWPR